MRSQVSSPLPEQAVAIIGMAGRFPGADNVEQFWQNVVRGQDTITRFTKGPHDAADYVAARGVLRDVDLFDAAFFSVTPVDAQRMDPQHRVLLEVAEEALEHAGYCSQKYPGEIGIFAGCSLNTYLLNNLCGDRAAIETLTANYQVGEFSTALGNDKDFLTTRIAYKLNLRGPAITVQSACATSLVAVAQAAQSLLNMQCDMALAGGVSITFPQERGHIAQEGSLLSGDGTCRPFDAAASGTVFGHGAGMVLLKRLEDAVADGDTIHAVLRGFAITNDGAEKVGYMAPGVNGQVRVIRAAQQMADLAPQQISYIEAHGTGTPLGDPVEFAALQEVFGKADAAYCTIGSAKANVGHLDAAAGVTGVIKTAMSLKERMLPGLAHFSAPNPHLPMEGSAFRFSGEATAWAGDGPLRAGVSAFGVGGVNAHVVLESAPALVEAKSTPRAVPLVLSARTLSALRKQREELAMHLAAYTELHLEDVAYTLAVGRSAFRERFAVVASTLQEAVAALREGPAVEGDGAAEAAARAWLAKDGGPLEAFFAESQAGRVPLPTYPFERQRFWVEAVAGSGVAAVSEVASAIPVAAEDAPVAKAASRLPQLRRRAAEQLHKVSGVAISLEEEEVPFLELGFDSLCMTQATQALSKAFGVPVTFRQLMEDADSLAKLADYLDGAMPPDPEVSAEGSATSGAVGALLEQQMTALSGMFAAQVNELRKLAGLPALAGAAGGAAATQVKPMVAAVAGDVKHGSFRTIQKTTQAMDAKQEAYLRQLVAAYQAKTPTSKKLTAESRRHLADPRAVAGFRPQWKEMVYPLVTDRAKGSRLYDVDGNEYIDVVNGYGCIMFGHSPDFVVEAAAEQMHTGVAIGPQSALAGEVAGMFAARTGNERVTFCNTGSEAVMAAIRVARTVTGRERVVYFTGDYHGTFDEVLVRSTPAGAMPIAPGIPAVNVTNITVLEYGSDESLAYLKENANDLAAVLIEPVQTRHPEVQPIEFIREIRKLTEAAGAAMILDEVVTGFRVAPGGFQEFAGVRADLCTYGKVLGGGYPLGVLAGKAKYMDALDGGAWEFGDSSAPEVGMTFFAGTFVRHPLALSIARAVLRHVEAEGPAMQSGLSAKAAEMTAAINAMFSERKIPFTVHGFCSWFYVSFPSEWKLAPLFYYAMRARGIHIQEGYPCFLTTAHSDADLAAVLTAFRETIAELHEVGIFPTGETLPPSTPAPRTERVRTAPATAPLTEPQREIFLAASLDDAANCAFNESLTLTLTGPVREDALRFALDAAVERHDALRSTVDESGENLLLRPAFRGQVEMVDLTAMSKGEQADVLRQRTEAEAATPFDLARGPLVRMVCFREAAERVTVLMTAHHIVLDGWSANELLSEIAAIYSGGTQALEKLPEPMSFGSYALTERERTEAGEFQANETYWLKRFEGRAPQLNLPTDRSRPVVRGFAGATFRGQMPAELLEEARKAGRTRGCSLYVVLLSSFQMLMHRLTQQAEVVVGISTAGQALLSGETLVGHCVHFLPMLSDLTTDQSVEQHWKATRSAMLDAQSHQEYTFGSLLRALKLARDSSRMPLIEVQFNLEKVGEGLSFDGLQATVTPNAKRFVNTDLFLNVMETPQGVEFACDYNTDLFDETTIARWMGVWQQLLASANAEPSKAVLRLPLLPPEQRETIVETWNATQKDFGGFEALPLVVARHASERPNAPAAECNGREWTYAELSSYSHALARRLVAEGVKPGDVVGISLDRSVELVGCMLAVMLAGAAYVPLDAGNPQERLDLIMSDARMVLLLTGRDPKIVSTVRSINVEGPQPKHPDTPLPAVGAGDLAYLIYTSGSTGVPKGVAVEHGALRNHLHSMSEAPGFGAADTMLAVTTVSFDIAELELLLPLLTGGRLVVATEDEARDGMLLLNLVKRSGVTTMQATPGLWRVLLDAGWSRAVPLKAWCGGEGLPRELAAQLIEAGTEVWNMYGPTETTIWSSVTRLTDGTVAPRIGGPIANTTFYVLDEQQQLVPVGVPGSLLIGGEGLARGYWHRQDLTDAVFVENPFGEGRLYRTGDVGRWFPDGTIGLAGRSDSQVKIRGYRIELGEVEAAFCGVTDVEQAVVLQQPATDNSAAALVAFVQLREGAKASAQDLRYATQRLLPEYMQPRDVAIVEKMPATANGKIDRRALLAGWHGESKKREVVAPATENETRLAVIWMELLGVKEVSVTDSVFELGADSLTIFRMAARCQKDGLPIKAAHILSTRTLRALAASLDTQAVTETVPRKPTKIQAVPRRNFIVRKES